MTRRTAAVERLPGGRRGPSGLSDEQVSAHQRARILEAMAGVVADKGLPAATVTDVITAAGVSRATFYEQFSDLNACFLAAFDAAASRVRGAVRAAPAGDVDALIGAYLDSLVADPASAKVFLVDIFAAGAEGIRRRADSQRRFTTTVAELMGATTEAEVFACEAFVAAVAMLVTTRIAAGELDGVRALRAPLVELAVRMLGGLRPAG